MPTVISEFRIVCNLLGVEEIVFPSGRSVCNEAEAAADPMFERREPGRAVEEIGGLSFSY
jgi:hypothetical protein